MNEIFTEKEFGTFLQALHFAAEKHDGQQRKDAKKSPYINHPIAVTEILWRVGGVRDMTTLVASLLHDTIEDTETSQDELRQKFGEGVLNLVMELTDDKSLPKAERKQQQIVNAPHKSQQARQIKLADKISNVHDITHFPPSDWPHQRKLDYLDWSEKVIDGLRGHNPALEEYYDRVLAEGRALLNNETSNGEQ
jgi:GTP diphosphokinase / guanosine-3',5'-bis(diphosphate) 3'-diphosphatase